MIFNKPKQSKLSIVIAAWNNISMLRECLLSLENQVKFAEIEVIVVSNFEGENDEIENQFNFAKFIFLSTETTVPQLRKHGISVAHGEIIALIEDLCSFDSGWCQEIITAHESQHFIIGGAIENASLNKSLNWAVYFFDYGKYMLPAQSTVIATLSGMNVSYKKQLLDRFQENYQDGFYDFFFNEKLKNNGYELYFLPSAIIYHHKNYEFKKTARQFYHQARSFAASRVSENNYSILKRLSLILISIILPFLLPLRVVAQPLKKWRHLKEAFVSFPSLIILMSVWAYGEFCGYVGGEGKSGREWK